MVIKLLQAIQLAMIQKKIPKLHHRKSQHLLLRDVIRVNKLRCYCERNAFGKLQRESELPFKINESINEESEEQVDKEYPK